MTHDEIDKLEAGPELDALIHERVMCRKPPTQEEYPTVGSGNRVIWVPPSYSTDIAAAWLVAEKVFIGERKLYLRLMSVVGGWLADVEDGEGEIVFEIATSLADEGGISAPLAICRAALKAAGA